MLTADDNPGLAERRRAVEIVAIHQFGVVRRRVKGPAPGAVESVKRIQFAIPGAKVDNIVLAVGGLSKRRRRTDGIACVVCPKQLAVGSTA